VQRSRGRRCARCPSPAPPSRTAPARRRPCSPTDGQPRLLLLHSSYVSGGGLGKGKPQLARVRAPGPQRCLNRWR
jgi:hypothetical protein